MFAPMAWWYAAIAIHGIVLEAFMELDHEDPGNVATDETLVAGPSSEETYRTRSFNMMTVGSKLIPFIQA